MDRAPRRLQLAVLMHGTSAYRQRAANLLVDLLQASRATGVAFGWTDPLNPNLLAPVHLVSSEPDVRWETDLPGSFCVLVGRDGSIEWKLLVTGVAHNALASLAPRVEYLKGYFAAPGGRDVPEAVRHSDAPGFLSLLDAYRWCGFVVAPRHARAVRAAFCAEIGGLPRSAHNAAQDTIDALMEPRRLQAALLELGGSLDDAGSFLPGAGVQLTAYELALHRCDPSAGVDAARAAGRAFRRAADLGSSLHWYGLAIRIAEFEQDWGRLALALDGTGNTYRHQGSFPRARHAYDDAWRYAMRSEDDDAIGNVAHSMMTVEREAGDLASAASFAWTSLKHRSDPETRANLLLNIGTLLRDGGDIVTAERAYRVARCLTHSETLTAMATDALAFCAALRGDADEYARRRASVLASAVREPFLRAQVGYFRGLSLAALGRRDAARRVLNAVERYARAWNLTEWSVKAAEADLPLPHDSPMDTPDELQQGLRQLEIATV